MERLQEQLHDKHLVYSAMRTPDGTVIESKHRHDYVVHDDKNGKHYMLDGGTDYVRSSINGDEQMLQVYNTDNFFRVRKAFRWGRNYDANGKLLPKTEWVLLRVISDDHLMALVIYPRVAPWIRDLFVKEAILRGL